jgi:2-polyprenyl-3-methyl-5-hydroxy-6-metoxy-1,4-benzoquinol methylase
MFDKEYQVLKEHAQEKPYWDKVHSREALCHGGRVYGVEWDYIVSQIPKKSSVAEVGCGRGFLLRRIKEEKKCSCYGYDLSSVAIEHVKGQGIDGEVHDFRKPQPNGRMFDCVVASHLLEHMEDENSLLKNLASMLKTKDGKVIVSVPTSNVALVAEIEHQRVYDRKSLGTIMKKVFKKVTIKTTQRKPKTPLLVAIGSNPYGN